MSDTQKSGIAVVGSKGGSKLKLDRTGFSANETVGLLFKIVLTLFWRRSMVAERSSFAKRLGWGSGEYAIYFSCASVLQTICTPPHHTTPMGFPSFPLPPENKQSVTVQSDTRQQFPPTAVVHAILIHMRWGQKHRSTVVKEVVQYQYLQ